MWDEAAIAAVTGGSGDFANLLEQILSKLSLQMTGKPLSRRRHAVPASEEWYTVYTLSEGAFPLILALYAPKYVLHYIACKAYQMEDANQDDLAECAMEFFNVFCGWTISALYQQLGRPVMLYSPRCLPGRYFPDMAEERGGCVEFETPDHHVLELRWGVPKDGIPPEEVTVFRRDKG